MHCAANKAVTTISEVTAPSSVIPAVVSALLPAAIPVRVCGARSPDSEDDGEINSRLQAGYAT